MEVVKNLTNTGTRFRKISESEKIVLCMLVAKSGSLWLHRLVKS